MPLSKILAPLMPRHRSLRIQKNNPQNFMLSPAALPLSPPPQNDASLMMMNENGDPIIDLATEEEETNSDSQDTLIDTEEVTENALVLHEEPTSFDNCQNDLIIEPVKREDDAFDQKMMMTETIQPQVTVNSAPEIDFTPPMEFMEDDTASDIEDLEPIMIALPPSPPILSIDTQAEQFEFQEPIQAESIQVDSTQDNHPLPAIQSPAEEEAITVPVQEIFEPTKASSESSEAHFAMKTSFRKKEVTVSKWSKMLGMVKVLVCKPEQIEEVSIALYR